VKSEEAPKVKIARSGLSVGKRVEDEDRDEQVATKMLRRRQLLTTNVASGSTH
jgi:hypothetical protein